MLRGTFIFSVRLYGKRCTTQIVPIIIYRISSILRLELFISEKKVPRSSLRTNATGNMALQICVHVYINEVNLSMHLFLSTPWSIFCFFFTEVI